jgi:Spy/CpxP family protein refolding chaperone
VRTGSQWPEIPCIPREEDGFHTRNALQWRRIGGGRRRKMKKSVNRFIWIIVLGLTLFFASLGFAAQEAAPKGNRAVTGGEGSEESSIEPQNIAPWMGMRDEWQRVPQTMAGKVYLWQRYVIEHRHDLGLTLNQQDEIGSRLNEQRKKWVRKRADQMVLFMEVDDLLLKEPMDLKKVEEKVKAIQALSAEMFMDEIRTLEKVLSLLTPEQRKTVEDFMRESTLLGGIRAY